MDALRKAEQGKKAAEQAKRQSPPDPLVEGEEDGSSEVMALEAELAAIAREPAAPPPENTLEWEPPETVAEPAISGERDLEWADAFTEDQETLLPVAEEAETDTVYPWELPEDETVSELEPTMPESPVPPPVMEATPDPIDPVTEAHSPPTVQPTSVVEDPTPPPAPTPSEAAAFYPPEPAERRWPKILYGLLILLLLGGGILLFVFSEAITDWLAGGSSIGTVATPARRPALPPRISAPEPIPTSASPTVVPASQPPEAVAQLEPPTPTPHAQETVEEVAEAPPTPEPMLPSPPPNPKPTKPEEPPPTPKGIRIQVRNPKPQAAPRLEQAYRALAQGQTAQARRHYQAVLRQHPRDRGALHGLAATETQAGNPALAKKYYSTLLRYHPRDALALGGLLSLEETPDPEAMGELKRLVADLPPEQSAQSAALYFALGNAQQRQRRWPEAQQAYFDAYRHDNQHPDYAYNLAVSLDQLGKAKAALPYYRQALTLAQHRAARFDRERLARRIETLEAR